MKTATVTWITHSNYGTDLQAYALQRYLLKCGHENTIISDKYIICPYLLSEANSQEIATDSSAKVSSVHTQDLLARIKRYILNPKVLVREYKIHTEYKKSCSKYKKCEPYRDCLRLIDDFKTRKLFISESYPKESMYKHNDMYDAFICGSDQIWSVFDINFNGYFYLDFVTKKKIAYSPSVGTDIISDEKKKAIKEYLQDFSAISVRENVSAVQLSELCGVDVEWVCDPTLLHDREFWTNFSSSATVCENKYMFCYFLGENEWYFSYVKMLAKYLRLKPVLIPIRESFSFCKWAYKEGVSPEKFVALIKNASFVVTDSYHAMIFSIIFEKKFLYLKRFKDDDPLCQNIRVDSLMGRLKLSQLYISEKNFEKKDVQNIDYRIVNQKISKFRESSKKFLNDSLR